MKTPECPNKSLSLDEAIAHADEVAGDCDTACRREHKQLADWLRELKNRRNGSGEVAKLREALKHIKDRLPHMLQYMRVHWEDASAGGYFDELMLVIDAALDATEKEGGAK